MKRSLSGLILLFVAPLFCAAPAAANLFDRMESRYAGNCFSVTFQQTSTLSAMEMTDTASGVATFSHPSRMRWEYKTPEPRTIVTDGTTLWIHSPLDRQVMEGEAATYFGRGKGGRFLSDIRSLREDFLMEPVTTTGTDPVRIKLTPKIAEPGLTGLFLEVAVQTGQILSITTENAYGDTTRIRFTGEQFHKDCPSTMFTFTPPPGTDRLEMTDPSGIRP